MTKFVFVTGGVLSSLGKGVFTASLGLLLKSMGLNITAVKIDPYINVDAGTMNPYMHGEVFVTEDGAETDLDLGHYERFLDVNLGRENNITTGQVYLRVINRERKGEYLGQCVQVIPHITDEVKRMLMDVARKSSADVVLVEIGGTVGDIEGLPFLEAARQMRFDLGRGNTLYIHVALAPVLPSGEIKTKPVQHSLQELRRIGIQPDLIVARSSRPLDEEAKRKIALFGNVEVNDVLDDPDLDNIYKLPLLLRDQGLHKDVCRRLELSCAEPDLSKWEGFVRRLDDAKRIARIAMVGKYTKVRDSYISIIESLRHAGAWLGARVKLQWFESTNIEEGLVDVEEVAEADGAVILPGFGHRGVNGKLAAIRTLRERNKPVLGICFGMQLMAVELARNVLGLEGANTTEVDPHTPHPVVDLLPSQKGVQELGGTMRLGSKPVRIVRGTEAWAAYMADVVYERHRHRYAINTKYVDALEAAGARISGYSEEGYPEIMELNNYETIFIGVQFHPEFKSRPLAPSPIYMHFLRKVLRSAAGSSITG